VQGISIVLNNESLAIINIYRHPNQYTSHPLSVLDNLLQLFFVKYRSVIFVGDFNAQSWWGCDYEDGAGKILARLIDKYNLVIINDGSSTILLPPGARGSVVDLVLMSANLAHFCSSVTNKDSAGNDHLPVYTFVAGTFAKKRVFAYKLRIDNKEIRILKQKLYY